MVHVAERDRDLIQQSFTQLTARTEQVAELFYDRLFEIDPELRQLFQGDMRQQGRKLTQTLAVVVFGLDHFERMVPVLQGLGRRHVEYGALPKHYGLVGNALIWTLEQMLGEAFTLEARQAWATLYGLIVSTMQTALPESAD
jgi:hemoglobin-like flavoprotein